MRFALVALSIMSWKKIVRISFFTVAACFAIILMLSLGIITYQYTPSATGQVVDGFTGNPIPNIDIKMKAILEQSKIDTADYMDSLTVHGLTDDQGRFNISSVLVPDMGILKYYRGWRLDGNGSVDWRDAEKQPLENVLNKSYFPFTISYISCSPWRFPYEICVPKDKIRDVQIKMVPVVDNLTNCKKSPYLDVREKCEQLNAWRLAFSRKDEALCKRLPKDWDEICKKDIQDFKDSKDESD